MMKALIIEDETAAARNLAAILRQTAPDVEIVATLESVEESVEWLRSNPHPDLLFMDIHLADGDSFRIFDAVEIAAPVIFTTAYDQYALEAFKVNSIDYILKPIKKEELRRAFDKLRRLSAPQVAEYVEQTNRFVTSRSRGFLIPFRDKLVPLTPEEIAYFHTSDERVSVATLDGRTLPVDRSLDTLMGQLPAADFYRANRQFIVSRRAIADLSVWFGSRLTLNLCVKTPERIVISKARVPEFKRWFLEGV